MSTRGSSASSFVIVCLLVAVVVAVSFLLHVLFSKSISNLTIEILAAVLAAVLIVASVGVTIHFQSLSETKREYRVALFQKKLEMYQKLLEYIASTDDDGTVDDAEIDKIRNQSLAIALVGDQYLMKRLAELIIRLPSERRLDSTGDVGSFRMVVEAMRKDLNVVESNVGEAVKHLVDRAPFSNGKVG